MIDTAYFLALTLVFIRLTTFLLIVKFMFPKGTPYLLKGALSMIIAYSIISGIDYGIVKEISNNYQLIITIINEVLTGLTLGFITNLFFEMVKFAGALMDMQAGLSMVQVVDPTTNVSDTILANLLYTISLVIFFVIDGHHILLRCLISSFDILPIGQGILGGETFTIILKTFTQFFSLGLKIALPIVLIIIITDLCMALISRVVPAINVMMLGMPVKILVGVSTFIFALPLLMKLIFIGIDKLPGIFQEIFQTITVVPIFFVFASDEKTEEATPKKKSEAKKKGQVPRSKEVGLALSMIACLFIIIVVSDLIVGTMRENMAYFLGEFALTNINDLSLKYLTINTISKLAICILPVAIPIMLVGIMASLIQTGFISTGEGLKPNFKKLNPISGFKNMFSKRSFVDLVKNLIVVTIVGFLGYSYIKSNYTEILQISNMYYPSMGGEIKNLVVGIFTQVTILLVILAAIDYFIQFKFHQKDLRMTKQEIKEEFKQMEGDPQIKSKIKQKQREMATRRMMQSVADATVVVTNPTHISVALKYDENGEKAPVVVAKGAEGVALRIKEKAKEENVPIMENKPLARLLFEKVEIEEEIPADMYEAVAEVLAMVYKMKGK